jgi:hypothetical protein
LLPTSMVRAYREVRLQMDLRTCRERNLFPAKP